MKRILSFILSICLIMLLTSCVNNVSDSSSNASLGSSFVSSSYNNDAENDQYIDNSKITTSSGPSKEDSSFISQSTENIIKPDFPQYIPPDYEVPKVELGGNKVGKIKAYAPPTADRYNNNDFEVAANVGDGWVYVPVCSAKVADYDALTKKYITYMSSFINLDFEGEMILRITSISRDIESVAIRPYSKQIKYSRNKNTVEFKVTKACNLSFEINGDIYRNLQIYCNNFETEIPSENNSRVIYLKPGVHNSNNCKYITMNGTKPVLTLYDNQTLYLEGGAYLEASVNVIGENTKILGRGVIDQLFANSPDCKYDSLADKNMHMQGISLNRCENTIVSGVIIRNSTSYTIIGSQCSKVTIDNVKTFACHTWSDGIDMMASHDITIKNCFIRSCDDSIAIYASRWGSKGDAYNWLVKDTVLWSDLAHTVNIGTHGSQNEFNRDEIYDIRFDNIDILEVNCPYPAYWGAIAMSVGDENIVRDCVFENIRIEDFSMSSMFYLKVKKNVSYNPNPGYLIDNILFKNITFNGKCNNLSEIAGYDASRLVKNVEFQNIIINGNKAENFNDALINVGEYTKNITIK